MGVSKALYLLFVGIKAVDDFHRYTPFYQFQLNGEDSSPCSQKIRAIVYRPSGCAR
jgi:hypothetical protein